MVCLSDCMVCLSDCMVCLSDCMVCLSDCMVCLSDCMVCLSDYMIVWYVCVILIIKRINRYFLSMKYIINNFQVFERVFVF